MANGILDYLGSINGSLIGLNINGNAVACETSCEFGFNVEALPCSSVESGRWQEYIMGVRSWTVTLTANLLLSIQPADFKTVLNAVLTGESMELEIKTRAGIQAPSISIRGTAYPTSGNIVAAMNSTANYNIQFVGTGPFEVDFEEFWLIINAMPATADKPNIVETDPSDW